MSNPVGGRPGARAGFTSLPQGETVATFAEYPAALEAVEKLAAAEFPVKQVSIVGHDLKSVERVTGRMSFARAAGRGAIGGLWIGAMLGLLTLAVGPQEATVSPTFLLSWVLLGAGAGMIMGVVSYSITRRRKNVITMTQVIASSYAVVVSGGEGAKARMLLGASPNPLAPVPGPTATPGTDAASGPTATSGTDATDGED